MPKRTEHYPAEISGTRYCFGRNRSRSRNPIRKNGQISGQPEPDIRYIPTDQTPSAFDQMWRIWPNVAHLVKCTEGLISCSAVLRIWPNARIYQSKILHSKMLWAENSVTSSLVLPFTVNVIFCPHGRTVASVWRYFPPTASYCVKFCFFCVVCVFFFGDSNACNF